MTISILGCGWFGTGLAKSLLDDNIRVKASTTSVAKLDNIRSYLVNIISAQNSVVDEDFFTCDILVIANNVRMNDEEAYLKRLNYTIELIRNFNIMQVVFISSTSVYGDHNTIVDETTPPRPETLSAGILLKGEQLLSGQADLSTTIIRFGGLIGPGRDPGRFFAGKEDISNGLAPVNLIHLNDCIGITKKIINSGINNPVINAVAPDHPPRQNFYTEASTISGLNKPHFVVEKAKWKIVESIYNDYVYTVQL